MRRIEYVVVFVVFIYDVVVDSVDVSLEIFNGGVKLIVKLCVCIVFLSNYDI